MRDDVDPFAVPAQKPRPHLVALVRLDLALEAAVHASQHDAPFPSHRLAGAVQHELVLHIVLQRVHSGLQQRAHQVRTRHIEVAVVSRVGLVEVVVALGERDVAGDDGREEEDGGPDSCGNLGRRDR